MKKKDKVLVVDKMHESIVPLFKDAGYEVDYLPQANRESVLQMIADYEGLVVRSKLKIDRELIDKATNLKFVARAGAGLDQIDYSYLSSKNIQLVNAPEGNRDALAEHAVGILLTLFNKINLADRQIRKGIWDREGNRGHELMGKTVGIYGFGFMGAAFAQRLQGFNCRVLVYDKYKTNLTTQHVTQVDLQTFQKEVEVLSLHIPLTSETRFLFDASYLAQFNQLKFLVNTSRGEVLRLSALNDLLEKGQLLGAALDVLENEKIGQLDASEQVEFDRLCAMDNVILTPHVAGWTFESYRKINEVMIAKLKSQGFVQFSH